MSTVTKRVTTTMVGGELTLAFWRVQDLREALEPGNDMGLPPPSPRSDADRILGLLLPHLADGGGET